MTIEALNDIIKFSRETVFAILIHQFLKNIGCQSMSSACVKIRKQQAREKSVS